MTPIYKTWRGEASDIGDKPAISKIFVDCQSNIVIFIFAHEFAFEFQV